MQFLKTFNIDYYSNPVYSGSNDGHNRTNISWPLIGT